MTEHAPLMLSIVLRCLCVLLATFGSTSCASRIWNEEIVKADPASDYVFANRLPRTNAQDVFIVLAFSGGGIRSAAFSYGILETLRDTEVTIDGRKRRLLDEVDVITSVSGGSYTAAYFGLFGDRIFDDFEDRFLKRDVQGALLALLANPINLISLTSADYNRGDLAARWLGDHVFENRTYADMSRGNLPYAIINASDFNTGITFSFIQQQFDFLCSNINDYPVANAVMASSATPVIFGPISVRNYDTDCPERRNSWVTEALETRDLLSRDYRVARALERYLAPQSMPAIRLVDGGITDNLGVRGSMMSPVAHYGNVPDMAGAFSASELDRVIKVLVVVANSQVYPDYDWSKEAYEPGVISTLLASFDAALNILNTETAALARRGFMRWGDRVNARRGPTLPKVTVHFTTLTFDNIHDTQERSYFNAMPTNLNLPDYQVDQVRSLARRLLQQSPDFQQFLATLQ